MFINCDVTTLNSHSGISLSLQTSRPVLINIPAVVQSQIGMLKMIELCLRPDGVGTMFLLAVAHRPSNTVHLAALEPEGLKPTLCFQIDNTLCCLSFDPLLRPRVTVHITGDLSLTSSCGVVFGFLQSDLRADLH